MDSSVSHPWLSLDLHSPLPSLAIYHQHGLDKSWSARSTNQRHALRFRFGSDKSQCTKSLSRTTSSLDSVTPSFAYNRHVPSRSNLNTVTDPCISLLFSIVIILETTINLFLSQVFGRLLLHTLTYPLIKYFVNIFLVTTFSILQKIDVAGVYGLPLEFRFLCQTVKRDH